jgi:hypothetical protein
MSEAPIRDKWRYSSLLVELLQPTVGHTLLSNLEVLDYDGDAGERQAALARLTNAVTEFLDQAKLDIAASDIVPRIAPLRVPRTMPSTSSQTP